MFSHLRIHTEYSLLQGACRIKALVRRAKEIGLPALAITDTNALFGAIEFYDACKAEGIKPIIGCEISVAAGSRLSRDRRGEAPYSLTLLCENNEGYQNLCRLLSDAWQSGGDTSPRCDRETLRLYNAGLIALSGGENGEVARLLRQNRAEDAKAAAKALAKIFPERFYLELFNHDSAEDKRLCEELRALSAATGLPLCPTNNVHYIEKSDAGTQRVLSCIGRGIKLSEDEPPMLPSSEYYLKDYDEMRRFFTAQELRATLDIAERCNVEFLFGRLQLPRFRLEGVSDNAAYMRELCEKGAKERYGEITEEVSARLKHELDIIIKMGFADYFLIVWDFVRYAKSRDIPVGPGRGSGAGSLCAYCMGITDIDPLRFNLLFERFLNPERVSMPDFDIDFCNERRGEVIEYVRRRYGSDHVAQIVAFDTMKAKGAIRDAARVMGLSPAEADRVAKLVSGSVPLAEEAERGALAELCQSDRQVQTLVNTAKAIEGLPRHTSVHAAGVVITARPVSEYVPLMYSMAAGFSEDAAYAGGAVTQYTMGYLERLGLLKMDFLGLRNLTVIKKAEEAIKKRLPDFDIERIDDSDPEVFRMLGSGGTVGVFQFESAGMTSMLSQLKPSSIEDLTAALSLYRPGPMASIPDYIANRHKSPDEISYIHPLLKGILSVTYGCMVYQEQVMQICREVGGFSYGRADLVRRAMAKKKHDVMEKERGAFIYGTDSNCGALANGVSEAQANEIFDRMAAFASYAFNKSHAAAYSVVAYRTAYLRRHFYLEYMTALTTSVSDWTEKMTEYLADMTSHGVKLLPPDVNKSFYGFSVEDGAVRVGLVAVKNLGRGFIANIVSEREEGGAFSSPEDFCARMAGRENNTRYMDALIRCGAFDALYPHRNRLLAAKEALLSYAADEYARKESGQFSLFADDAKESAFVYPDAEPLPPHRLLEMEKESIGIYVSGHPASEYLTRCAEGMYICDAANERNVPLTIVGMVTAFKAHTAKNGRPMAFATFEDETAAIEAVIFPDVFAKCERPREGLVYCVRGKVTEKDDKLSLICDGITRAERLSGRPSTLFVKLPCRGDRRAGEIAELFRQYKGAQQARLCFDDTREVVRVEGVRGVRICEALLSRLKKLCGGDAVKVVER